ncbi:TetR/AcrR family transcriptional regulator [Luteimonas wenzhouensis]|jgi:TetR/AcrR family transcriptional repressor of mexJK operon|uniref:TetR family transcriptional regulator n=1 Tax=Luteimonas wenzhouensis TaxID=2599615 RepID=A0A5C5TRP0_9GAMM|nr:TetR/AcrR family transcriptional regulator [Luteimonas wenzhouensis]NLW97900.1 TetR/AcrR family transcriptional regulator [Xanthomonadaceae bacterium]TWT16971.1 TetR family transcriptional regulator [Luteimonas wenzhouensis]
MSAKPSKPAEPQRPAPGPGRPKDLAKRAAILDAAVRMFTRLGFEGASMDQIAAEAGVSKLTVYSHFGDKEALFGETVRVVCASLMPDDLFVPDPEAPLRAQLAGIARAFFTLITSDEALATHRLMMSPGSGERLCRMFWQAGPERTQRAFATFLAARAARGELDLPDVQRAARQFFALLKGDLHTRMACGLCERPDPAGVEAHIQATVDMFLRAYATRPAAAGR